MKVKAEPERTLLAILSSWNRLIQIQKWRKNAQPQRKFMQY